MHADMDANASADMPQSPDGIQIMASLSRQVVLIDDASAAEIDNVIRELGLEEEGGDVGGDNLEQWVAKYAG